MLPIVNEVKQMDFRMLDTADRSEIENLWDYCFEKREDPFFKWFFLEYFQYDRTIGGFTSDGLQTMLNLAPYDLTLKGKKLQTSYIIGVATWPQSRGQGTVKELLRKSLEKMKEWQEPLAILMPSRAEFYYPFDFQLMNHHLRLNIKVDDFRRLATKECTFKKVSENDLLLLNQLYEEAYGSYEGLVDRSPKNWKTWLDVNKCEGGEAYFIENKGKVEGYFFYQLQPEVLRVSDWAVTTSQARAGMAQFFYQHRAQTKHVEWEMPLDDPWQYILPDTRSHASQNAFMTARIVDVTQLISLLPWSEEGEVIFELEDPLLPWNQGIFKWSVIEGRGQLERSAEKPKISLTIGALAQWIFGQVDGRILKLSGSLRGEEQSISQLERWMPRRETYLNEYF